MRTTFFFIVGSNLEMQQTCVRNVKARSPADAAPRRARAAGRALLGRGAELNRRGGAAVTHSRGLVHFLVDLLDRQLDVELDAVEDVLEIRLLIHLELQKTRQESLSMCQKHA